MTNLEIKGFQETSFLDWDGKVVSVLYVPLCNFRCPFCHNSGLIENPQQYETVSLEKIEAFLLERKEFIDGICLTGGEPCLHKDRGLFEFIHRLKVLGFKVKFDTNGSDPQVLRKLISEKLVDYIAMDLKGPLDHRYDRLTGIKTDLNKVKQSLALIMESGVDYEFRTTVVPTLLMQQDLVDLVKEIRAAKKFVLQQFVPNNCWSKELRLVNAYPLEKLEEMKTACLSYNKNTVLRGV